MSAAIHLNQQQALGFLIMHAINSAFADADIEGSCCIHCCGPCAAVDWYGKNARDEANTAIKAADGGDPNNYYDWQDPITGDIDWIQVEAIWEAECPNADDHPAQS